ncbi:MAG: hypothetical protein HY069_01585 [Chlamydiia bacterium]|nr:hypothetical protein [Chlamydiia bacterium]
MRDYLKYALIRLLVFPIGYLPLRWIRALGNVFGLLAFHLLHQYRKKTLSNLALAQNLHLSPAELIQIAKSSFQNLVINCLEYAKWDCVKSVQGIIECENPEVAQALHDSGQGILFFCGHQSNWEALFLDGTSRMKGMAIGRPIRNRYLYQWIVSIREKFGGTLIEPRNAVRLGCMALRKGTFLGIVGDQGKPDSPYCFPFFGRRAWTSSAPAFLAYRTRSPIIFAETRRVKEGYRIRYSDPIWPDTSQSLETEMRSLMDRALTLLEQSIRQNPGEWLWQHNRWKQPTPHNARREFGYDCLAIILPPDPEPYLPALSILQEIYHSHFVILLVPKSWQNRPLMEASEIFYYETMEETLRLDYRSKFVFNFTNYAPIRSHYLNLSALHVFDVEDLKRRAPGQTNFTEIVKRSVCKEGTLWRNDAR